MTSVAVQSTAISEIATTVYDRSSCQIGVVHLGFGAFHRAHQAVYLDDYMDQTGDLRWGVAAVNLRESEASHFKNAEEDIKRHDGFFLKTYSPDGEVTRRRVRSHVYFSDWSIAKQECEGLLALPSVHMVTITVTESGYYTDPNGRLDLEDPTIKAEVSGDFCESVYAYLRNALIKRIAAVDAPLTIACCDNIRQNGKMLRNNLLTYLVACDQSNLASWVESNVTFPCSMVDRITPRSPTELNTEFAEIVGSPVTSPIMSEAFSQWVFESQTFANIPELANVGVIVTADVNAYEETKIRVLNGGHTALAYLAALEGIETFDAAMRVPHLLAHFQSFETEEVLPALTLDLPFSKANYLKEIVQRFSNTAIGDTVARICADGMAKFPIFIRPTLEGCLNQGIMPVYAIRSIASWYVFAQHVNAGNIGFKYVEPAWNELQVLLGTKDFLTNRQLWGELPVQYPDFVETLQREIVNMELKWSV
ncbi:MAG: mannitol dehydrogenase family protein [Gammaproteobacteria bacterium]|nr:mannitol dehydrogenase family protein [Gammaproteobacteria bacterium]